MKRVVGVVAAFALLLFVAVSPAHAGLGDVETPTVEKVTGPGTPWAATDKDLDSYGYVEEEFKYEGDAFRYDTSGDPDVTGTRLTTGGPNDDGKFPYRTRMIVRRPANPADFNGTVVVEWQNVTATFDLEANWFGDPEYLLENGYAYVAVSAQRVGVNSLRGWNPDRYGDLDVSARDEEGAETINNDALSYDIYAAAIKSLLDAGDGDDPLGNLDTPETVIASGESQSGGRLNTYYNKIQPIHELVDAFLLTVSYGALRDDRSEPVIRVLSETENRTPRTLSDMDNYRQWEVAGGSHLPRMAFENFQTPIERDLAGSGLTLSASCEKYPLSRVQWPFVVNAAYEHLVRWSNGGPAAPTAPRGEYQDTPADPADQLVRNGLGIAEGGIRLPEVSVPARLNTGSNAAVPGGGVFSAFCFLLGSSEDLTDDQLTGLYSDWADYMAKVRPAAQQVVNQGYMLEQDLPRLIAQHEEVPNIRPTVPQRTSGKAQNKGKFKLEWEGTKNELGTFQLQHSKNNGKKWSAVPGAKALTEPSFQFKSKRESDGKWIYRVRSNTTIPEDAAREEFVVTTPWSEVSQRTTVDRSGPKVKLKCPKKVKVGKRAFARIKAKDKGVGLKKDPSGKKKINTRRKGTKKIKVKAVDKLGNKTKKTCKVKVVKKK